MLTCIACSKQLNTAGSLPEPPEDDGSAAAPSTKQAIKTLTAQIKDMAVKASGGCKNCKPCAGSSGHGRGRDYLDSDAGSVSERFYGSYRRAGSSESTPRLWGKEMDVKLKALSSGYATPTSVSSRSEAFVLLEEDEPKEWVAQVEPGVLITFVSLPQCGNDIKRIRFSHGKIEFSWKKIGKKEEVCCNVFVLAKRDAISEFVLAHSSYTNGTPYRIHKPKTDL